MKKVLAITMILTIAIAVSCNKNQKAVKELDGTWKLVKVNDEAIADSLSSTVTFENCKLKKEEYCDMTTTAADGTQTVTEYQVVDDGTILVTKIEDPSSGAVFEVPASIDELTDTKLVLTTSFGEISASSEYEKQ